MKLGAEEAAFVAAAEVKLLRLLAAWGGIETEVPPRMRRVIEAALLLATVQALLDMEDDHDGAQGLSAAAACGPATGGV